ncbi:diguanylate cyclase (GGDEF)-like protein/PAS domain S-box-containing protein [Arthrobacter sp. PvP023]|uniref:putative bifunctional diguanylate cyclase/phosphodiesterase n=1 Tax=Micrococcaceae TaxID=1268 RepID=UPI001AE18783|nr:EAL domain-containing protein [Arthrobacter sp. PvP023]MBP1137268.1 diguanylate cyclase (GGDEF)-like protein/PAS domain S-box-containing protein [Arthrobacter sp. PvP023]
MAAQGSKEPGSVSGRDYQAIIDSLPDALLVLAQDGTVMLMNPAAERVFGYSRHELVGHDHRIVLAEGYRLGFQRLFKAFRSGPPSGYGSPFEAYGLRKDGTEFKGEIACGLLEIAAGLCMSVSVRDMTHREEPDDGLREAMSLLSATLESTADGILVVGTDGQIAGVNEQFVSMWGIPRELLATHDDDAVISYVLGLLKRPQSFLDKVRDLYEHPLAESNDILEFTDGRTFERYSRPQKVADKVVGRVWSFRDVTPRLAAQDQAKQALADLAEQAEQLKALAFQDPLTGLANRKLFHDQLAASLRGTGAGTVDVLLLDLDDFKEVNDILGHHAGDEMLTEVARRLRSCVRPDDTVARLGGDEFVVLLTGSPEPDAIAERIVDSLNVPMWIDGTMLRPSLSLGLASAGPDVAASELLRQADVAMYAAKAAGKNRYMRFEPEMMTALVQRTDMEAGLRLAVDSGQIMVHYQPVISPKLGEVVQFEALARWKRDGELVPPGQFIPTAERSGLISAIGMQVMRHSFTELRPWLAGDATRSVAVNISGVQLKDCKFADGVLQLAASCGADPRQLVLEVTESVFFDPDAHVIRQLDLLRDAGVRVALDDFGTGYSSLGRLQELPVDAVKIDRSFVSMVRTGAEKLPILNSMINMAHSLGLTVTAEGIETAAQAGYLTNLDCDSLQGYLFSHPEPESGLDLALLRSADAIDEMQGLRLEG